MQDDKGVYYLIDYASKFPDNVKQLIKKLRHEKKTQREQECFKKLEDSLTKVKSLKSSYLEVSSDAIKIGKNSEIDSSKRNDLKESLESFIPWKKGPFDIFGIMINSEWKSNLKWERLEKHLPNLEGKKIADIGCNNGYYMFKMLKYNPQAIVGFEPVIRHWLCFEMMKSFIDRPLPIFFEPFGVEYISYYKSHFDVIFCLGILYHHTDPIQLLRNIRQALSKNGSIIIDCQGIPGEDSIALVPTKKYAGAKGTWFLPTLNCLINWINRSGYNDIKIIYNEELSTSEQRETSWAPIASLKEFISLTDSSKTIENYPRPRRFYIKAKK